MKKILMIGTGGTIASAVSEDGLVPELSSEQLIAAVPHIRGLCNVTCKEIFKIDSTNMEPFRWLELALEIRKNYEAYDGFVISHGTDTMAYTAAALSYLIQNSPKPIVLTGAQKPIGNDSTDSRINLIDSFICATSEMPGVQIVFNGKVIAGTRAQKTRSKSFEAFSSINFPVLGVIQDEMLLKYIENPPDGPLHFYDRMNSDVGLMKLIPGTKSDQLEWMLERFDAVVVESFGVGGLPTYKNEDLHQVVRKYAASGKIIVMTTQVANEGSNLAVYEVGSALKQMTGVLEAYDMTTEAVVTKLMWILGQTSDPAEVERMLYTPVAHDLLRRP